MGATACAPVADECRPACCNDGRNIGADSNLEYEPRSRAEQQQEVLEPTPPLAVSSTAAVRKATAAVSREPASPASPSAPAASASAGSPKDALWPSHSYFARELPEFAELVPSGPDGQRPPFTFRTRAVYVGQWKGARRDGFGIQTWPDGASFAGMWEDNAANGIGKFVHADGDVFVGQWRANTASGCGAYYHKRGLTTYRGQWVEDLQHGHGVEEWEGGSTYTGQFCAGKKQGYGIYSWADGSQYAGQWWANSINGYGNFVKTGPDGRKFHGMWRDAVIHGCGKYEWPDRRTFCGQYQDDQKHGFGIFRWMDGRRFEGFWFQGKQHGYGATYDQTGEVLRIGTWDMGVQNNDADSPSPRRQADA